MDIAFSKKGVSMEKIENKSICAKCGGFCCKKSGCDYFVSDFDNLKLDYLIELLNTGNVSVVASLDFQRLSTGKLVCSQVLSLRARNINRDVIDLLSFKTTCSKLTETGCSYDLSERPSGGATLIPGEDMTCHSDIDRIVELKKWIPYQKVLERLVKRFTGMSVHAKLKEDVENLFYDILCENFEGVMDVELYDVQSMLPLLNEAFPEEAVKATKRYQTSSQRSLK